LGSDAFRPPELLRRMVAEGKLGKKSGRGFYEWND
jgi:3-hydroxybutyryl-CoA dehydrogenase